ncbi:PDR/VanB family oxidoreductase [Streptomyces arenae]|nr:PDR/VanB family oxidoreductase [Streptomyces arenae]MCG7205098.1 PDR/VanB family oxidoreductase [Streptomyces arenae]
MNPPPAAQNTLRVVSRTDVADSIAVLTLEDPEGRPLPAWEPGAHVDLVLDPGVGAPQIVRQYSLCGDPADRHRWRVAVLRVPDGRGGSELIHRQLRPGSTVATRTPRNAFPLRPAAEYLFLAGGIGITPILPMVAAAERAGTPWRFVYLGRSRSHMALIDEAERYGPERVTVHADDTDGIFDVTTLLDGCNPGTAVYSCGPGGLLSFLERQHTADAAWSLHLERFTPAAPPTGQQTDDAPDEEFEAELASTGAVLRVSPGCSLLDALLEAGADVDWSCREGNCGACETGVVSGTPDHRDSVLTPEERAAGASLMPCVSRAAGRIVLDL